MNMDFTRLLQLAVALFVVGPCAVMAAHYPLTYNCDPSGDIYVPNPDKNTLKSATAGNDNKLCNVTISADSTLFTISGCNKNEDVQFTLSVRDKNSTGDGIIGGSYSETYVIQCIEIDDSGVFFNSSLGMAVVAEAVSGPNATTNAPGYTAPVVTPMFTIASSIWDSTGTTLVTQANMGDLLKWKVQGPYEYDLLPYTCTANAGSVLGIPPMVTIIHDGCPVVNMITGFMASSVNASERGSIVSDLYAFKFAVSDELTIACSVKICTRGNAACIVNCSDSRRRRRAQYKNADDKLGMSTSVVSRITVLGSGAETHEISYFLMASSFAVILGQCMYYLRI